METASDELIGYILNLVPCGGTILELGSGDSTQRFVTYGRKVVTIEHDPAWLHKVRGCTYLHAPIKEYGREYQPLPSVHKHIHSHTGWYDAVVLEQALREQRYDLIFVDGPPRNYGRSGFYQHLSVFPRLDVPIVFDDVGRIDDLYIAERVAQVLGRDLLIKNFPEIRTRQKANGDWQHRLIPAFGVIMPCSS